MDFFKRVASAALAVTALLFFAACSDPIDPNHVVAGPLRPGLSISGTLPPAKAADSVVVEMPANGAAVVEIETTGNTEVITIAAGGLVFNPTAIIRDGHRKGALTLPPKAREYTVLLAIYGGIAPERTTSLRYKISVREVATAPEGHGSSISYGTFIRNEPLETRSDVDRFTFQATIGDELIVLPANLVSGSAIVLDSHDVPLTESETSEFRAMTVRETGRHSLLVMRTAAFASWADTLEHYSIQLHVVNAAPESAPAMLDGVSAVSESIDHWGDRDEYRLSMTPGDLYRVSLTASSPEERIYLHYDLPGELEGDDLFRGHATHGSDVLRIRSSSSWRAGPIPYLLHVRRLPLKPETHSGVFAFGDTIRESLDSAEDIDDFPFTITSSASVWFAPHVPTDAPPSALEVWIINEMGDQVGYIGVADGGYSTGAGQILPAGGYRVRVRSISTPAYVGPYMLVASEH